MIVRTIEGGQTITSSPPLFDDKIFKFLRVPSIVVKVFYLLNTLIVILQVKLLLGYD